ncbi:hypothetical protein H9L10_09530 [Phycicoccus endophyticus]|uniref:Pyridoxamine 5'-phosphate oxidase family protein n=1 Tax=Phycicoccus endophyticus TaxID=1690220 RepID=A0A7G9QYY5_9MICO|nr:hypothetical protein [Phycicoccus endophyticus]NHI18898.1 hypothetical protein [Phycicoccus endophyticus]QNN48560.1 hypothetical protein H9L10_09530 [Phycicoccus endophyticus]GGL31230.1 hypothetical protein GCM10012283_11950 [Phycicoccus endophyticus]
MPDEAAPPAPAVDLARLVAEAAAKSGMLWVRTPDGRSTPVWHAWRPGGGEDGDGPAVYVVSGPGEQHLPWLPAEVELVLRSKDSGGRLLTVPATAEALEPGSPAWETAAEALVPERLNAQGSATEVTARWRAANTVHRLTPRGSPTEYPGSYDDGSGAAPVRPAGPATARWRPWHWRGRAGARRNTSPGRAG